MSSSINGFDRVPRRHNGQRLTGTNEGGRYRIPFNPRFGGLQVFERHRDQTQRDLIDIYGFRALVIGVWGAMERKRPVNRPAVPIPFDPSARKLWDNRSSARAA